LGGILSHYRDAIWQVQVPASHKIEVAGKAVDIIRFMVDSLTETTWCHRYTTHEPDPNNHAPGRPLYRFAYYLVLLDIPNACERCYVPLLISPEPMEQVARSNSSDIVL
jgi:hypothetical protein